MSTSTKTFELLPLISLMNKHLYLNVTKKDVNEIIDHVHGPLQESETFSQMQDQVIDHLAENYPRLVEAAAMLIHNTCFDEKRYGSLMNLCRKFHEIETMSEPVTAN